MKIGLMFTAFAACVTPTLSHASDMFTVTCESYRPASAACPQTPQAKLKLTYDVDRTDDHDNPSLLASFALEETSITCEAPSDVWKSHELTSVLTPQSWYGGALWA